MNGLYDVGWRAQKFTWSNRNKDETFTKERLDRAIANQIQLEKLNTQGVEVMNSSRPNHQPILLSTKEELSNRPRKKKTFKFEAKWFKDKQSELVIYGAWTKVSWQLNSLRDIQLKLKDCSRDLTCWSAKQMRDSEKEIKEKVGQLKQLQNLEGPGEGDAIRTLDEEIAILLGNEDIKWK